MVFSVYEAKNTLEKKRKRKTALFRTLSKKSGEEGFNPVPKDVRQCCFLALCGHKYNLKGSKIHAKQGGQKRNGFCNVVDFYQRVELPQEGL